MKTLNLQKTAVCASFCAIAVLASCSKPDGPNKPDPGTDPITPPDENVLEMKYTTDVYYYGDKDGDGLYNYFLGLCDKPFILDDTGDEGAPEGGSLVYLDFYSATGADSWEEAVLPDGEYTWSKKDFEATDMEDHILHGYFTRLQVMGDDGKQKSIDFSSGTVTVATGDDGTKMISGSFTLEQSGKAFVFSYSGAVVFGDPNEGGIGHIESPVDFTAQSAAGEYSEQYMPGISTYTVLLTDAPIDDNGYINGAGYVVSMPFFNETGSLLQLAPGTYPVNDTYEAGSLETGFDVMGPTGTYIMELDEHGEVAAYSIITGGSATVSSVGETYTINAELLTDKAVSIKCSYTGELYFYNADEEEAESPTTLTGDLELDLEGAEVMASYYGDYYGIGADNWLIEIANAQDYITIDLICEAKGYSETLPAGQYNMSTDNGHGMMTGYLDREGYAVGTWYMQYDESWEIQLEHAAAIDGSLKISQSEETVSIEIGLVDSQWNLISGVFSGKAETFDESGSMSMTKSLIKGKGRKAHMTSSLYDTIRKPVIKIPSKARK